MSLTISLGKKTQLPRDFAHNKRPSLAYCKQQENFKFWWDGCKENTTHIPIIYIPNQIEVIKSKISTTTKVTNEPPKFNPKGHLYVTKDKSCIYEKEAKREKDSEETLRMRRERDEMFFTHESHMFRLNNTR